MFAVEWFVAKPARICVRLRELRQQPAPSGSADTRLCLCLRVSGRALLGVLVKVSTSGPEAEAGDSVH